MNLSIIIPTFNSGKTLKCCLDSIVVQTYEDYEVLVMDGASDDNTISIAQSYKDERIRVYSEPDKGIYDAMNKGIDKSSGRWIYFLGSDDRLLNPQVLEKVSIYMDDSYDVVYGEVESQLPDIHRGVWTLSTIHANRCHQAIFYNRRYYDNGLRYNLKYCLLADYDINLSWFLQPDKYVYKHIPVIVAYYSMEGLSSKYRDTIFYNDYEQLLLKYGNNSLTPKYKKRCYIGLSEKADTFSLKFKYTLLRRWYYLLQKTGEIFGIDQDVMKK